MAWLLPSVFSHKQANCHVRPRLLTFAAMGFLDLFRKKAATPQPEGRPSLDALIRLAASEPAYRNTFFRQLLSDELYVLTQEAVPTHPRKKDPQPVIKLIAYPDGKIPVFTSRERIYDQDKIQDPVFFIHMNGRSLLERTQGATLLLNPYSDTGRELLPEEIDRLLDGSFFESGS